MRTNNKILKINSVDFPSISFTSRNGEHRIINFKEFFKSINLEKDDFGYQIIGNKDLFNSVTLEDNALAWNKLSKEIALPSGKIINTFFHIDPIMTIEHSDIIESDTSVKLGTKIKYFRKLQNLSQEELAIRIGTSKHYISRVENLKTDLEFKTLEKIFEIGLNKKIYIALYDEKNKLNSLSNSLLKPSFLNWIDSKKDDLTLIDGISNDVFNYFKTENILSPYELSKINFSLLLDILARSNKPISFYSNVDSWLIQAKLIANSQWVNLIMIQKTVGSNHSKIEDLAKKELKDEIFEIQ